MFATILFAIAIVMFLISVPVICIEILFPDIRKVYKVIIWIIKLPAIIVFNGINILVLFINLRALWSKPEAIIAFCFTVLFTIIGIIIIRKIKESKRIKIIIVNSILFVIPIISFMLVWIIGVILDH